MHETETPAPAETTPALADPNQLVTGKPLPTRPHTFRRADGTKLTVLLQGLPYARKSLLDAGRRQEMAEAQSKGVAKTDLYLPRMIAEAARMPNGKRAFVKEEDAMLFAIRLADEMGDGQIHAAYNAVLELSGWGEDAEADAGKS